jgi:hypothetical protein
MEEPMAEQYGPLEQFLRATPAHLNEVILSFDQIEQLLGRRLPASATDHRPWWANQQDPSSHSHALAWMHAGFNAGPVDRENRWVRFHRQEDRRQDQQEG